MGETTNLISKELHPTARTEDVKRLRMCRGWLKMWSTRIDKEIQAEGTTNV